MMRGFVNVRMAQWGVAWRIYLAVPGFRTFARGRKFRNDGYYRTVGEIELNRFLPELAQVILRLPAQ
jgi:hypothetical protein